MKINEFIEKASYDCEIVAKRGDSSICVYDNYNNLLFRIPLGATNFLKIDWSVTCADDSLSREFSKHLSELIEEFLKTPVKDRFSEKKYRLRWIDSKLSGLNSFPCYLFISSNCWDMADNDLCGKAIFTESELNKLKKDNPRLAPAIDALKEEIDDDE